MLPQQKLQVFLPVFSIFVCEKKSKNTKERKKEKTFFGKVKKLAKNQHRIELSNRREKAALSAIEAVL